MPSNISVNADVRERAFVQRCANQHRRRSRAHLSRPPVNLSYMDSRSLAGSRQAMPLESMSKATSVEDFDDTRIGQQGTHEKAAID